MKFGVALASIALCLAVSGCAAPWHKPGASQSEFEQTLSACQMEAQRAVPAVIAYRMSPGHSYTTNHCDKHDRCTEETTYQPPTMTPYDQNEGMRNQHLRACLFRHGWSDEEQK